MIASRIFVKLKSRVESKSILLTLSSFVFNPFLFIPVAVPICQVKHLLVDFFSLLMRLVKAVITVLYIIMLS